MTYKEFCEIIYNQSDFICIHEEKMDIGGGKIAVKIKYDKIAFY